MSEEEEGIFGEVVVLSVACAEWQRNRRWDPECPSLVVLRDAREKQQMRASQQEGNRTMLFAQLSRHPQHMRTFNRDLLAGKVSFLFRPSHAELSAKPCSLSALSSSLAILSSPSFPHSSPACFRLPATCGSGTVSVANSRVVTWPPPAPLAAGDTVHLAVALRDAWGNVVSCSTASEAVRGALVLSAQVGSRRGTGRAEWGQGSKVRQGMHTCG